MVFFWTIFGLFCNISGAIFFNHFIDYSWVGRWTINTQGKVGGRLKVLREGWDADYHVYRKHET